MEIETEKPIKRTSDTIYKLSLYDCWRKR